MNLYRKITQSFRQQKVRVFANHVIGIALTVDDVATKNFSPFAYNEARDCKRACMNCETLLTLGERPPYNCFPHPVQTIGPIARAESRPSSIRSGG